MKRPSTYRLVAYLLLAVGIIILLLTVMGLRRAYYDTDWRLQSQVRLGAHAMAGRTQWMMAAIRQNLSRIDRLIEGQLTFSKAAHPSIAEALSGLPVKASLWVFDALGQPVFTTDSIILRDTPDEKKFFGRLKEGLPFYITPLFVRSASSEPSFAVAKRIERDGQFAGALVLVVSATNLARDLRRLDLGENSTIGLFNMEGDLVARYPAPNGPLNLKNYTLFTDLLPKSSEGIYDTISPADGVHRMVGYATVDNEELVTIASAGRDEYFRTFWLNSLRVAAAIALTLAALIISLIWLVKLIKTDDRKRQELAAALDENNLLFQEIHHRVKNNLQSVSGLINLETELSPARKAQLLNRIHSMSALHEDAYRRNEYGPVDLSNYLPKIIEHLSAAYADKADFDVLLAPITVDRDTALPIGLIINEAITNALKHAFPDDRKGKIIVRLKKLPDGKAQAIVQDNGVGGGTDLDKSSSGIGARLIAGLAKQVGATATTSESSGTKFELTFPARKVSSVDTILRS